MEIQVMLGPYTIRPTTLQTDQPTVAAKSIYALNRQFQRYRFTLQKSLSDYNGNIFILLLIPSNFIIIGSSVGF